MNDVCFEVFTAVTMNITVLGCDAVSSGRRIDVSQEPAAFVVEAAGFSETSLHIYLTRYVCHVPSDGSLFAGSPLPYFILSFKRSSYGVTYADVEHSYGLLTE